MYRLNSRVFYVSNTFQNTNFPIHEIFCVSPPPYYLYWFETPYPSVPLNWGDSPFCLQYMNGMQGKNPSVRQWNRILDELVTFMKYKKITIDNAIYIKIFPYCTVSYLTVSTDNVLNTKNNVTAFYEIITVFQ